MHDCVLNVFTYVRTHVCLFVEPWKRMNWRKNNDVCNLSKSCEKKRSLYLYQYFSIFDTFKKNYFPQNVLKPLIYENNYQKNAKKSAYGKIQLHPNQYYGNFASIPKRDMCNMIPQHFQEILHE